jgi:hypothetical protein
MSIDFDAGNETFSGRVIDVGPHFGVVAMEADYFRKEEASCSLRQSTGSTTLPKR